jgi:acyl-CoA thioesterase-2
MPGLARQCIAGTLQLAMTTIPDPQDPPDFLRSFTVRPAGDDVFEALTTQPSGRLLGGLVLGQAVVAASETAPGAIHSLHAYFLRPGKPGITLRHTVRRIRSGRTFDTRRVEVTQGEDQICEVTAQFTAPRSGISYQQPMPPVPPPDGLPDWIARVKASRKQADWFNRLGEEHPLELRDCDPVAPREHDDGRLPRRTVWVRIRGGLPEGPVLHAAAMAYMSDTGLNTAVRAATGLWDVDDVQAASLDHAIWWHEPPRFDSWLLYVSESHAAAYGRSLTLGRLYREDGTLVASVAQEGYFH